MPCTDERLDDYINKINKLENSGVNISNIIDYKLVRPKNVLNGNSFTKGVFLEKKAKGNCIADIKNINICESDNIEEIIDIYLNNIDNYLNELEIRSNAGINVFDKLIDDYLSVFKIGLSPDPKPLNFFYDEKEGFTIIDLIDVESKSLEGELKNLARMIYIIIFGYGIPKLIYKYNNLNIIPKEVLDKFNSILYIIEDKLITSLVNVGIDKEIIINSIINNREKYKELEGVVDFRREVKSKISKLNIIKEENKENPLEFTF